MRSHGRWLGKPEVETVMQALRKKRLGLPDLGASPQWKCGFSSEKPELHSFSR